MKRVIISAIILITTFLLIQLYSPELAMLKREFNSEKWKSWIESEEEFRLRWEMIGSLRIKHRLRGLTKKEIVELLGQPENKSKTEFSYNLGMSGNGINSGILKVKFNEINICINSDAFDH